MGNLIMHRLTLRSGIVLTICPALLPLPGFFSLISEAAQGQGQQRQPRPRPGKPVCLGCSANQGNRLLSSSSSPVSNSSGSQGSSIRKIDFGNFEYVLSKGGGITLRNGKYEGNAQSEDYSISLSHLAYGDVTRDGSEEAMVVLFEDVRGSAIPYHVFIYTIADGLPALLWSFETGDRADGGLRQVYAENGDLVIELYGKGTSIGGKLYGTEEAVCCPKFFSRTRHQWSSGGFVKKGDREVSVNSLGGAGVIMPRN